MTDVQRSVGWHEGRAGRITASRMRDVLARSQPKFALCVVDIDGTIIERIGNGKAAEAKAAKMRATGHDVQLAMYDAGEPLKARADYLAELVCERLTGESITTGTAAPMQWGKDVEEAARTAYEARMGVIVQASGFVTHPDREYVGASPDGLIGPDGGMESKCPWNLCVHLNAVRYGMPDEHMPQVQTGMWCTGRAWWDFVSYDPRYPAHLRLYVQRIPRDDAYIARMARECDAFEIEIRNALRELETLEARAA